MLRIPRGQTSPFILLIHPSQDLEQCWAWGRNGMEWCHNNNGLHLWSTYVAPGTAIRVFYMLPHLTLTASLFYGCLYPPSYCTYGEKRYREVK